ARSAPPPFLHPSISKRCWISSFAWRNWDGLPPISITLPTFFASVMAPHHPRVKRLGIWLVRFQLSGPNAISCSSPKELHSTPSLNKAYEPTFSNWLSFGPTCACGLPPRALLTRRYAKPADSLIKPKRPAELARL